MERRSPEKMSARVPSGIDPLKLTDDLVISRFFSNYCSMIRERIRQNIHEEIPLDRDNLITSFLENFNNYTEVEKNIEAAGRLIHLLLNSNFPVENYFENKFYKRVTPERAARFFHSLSAATIINLPIIIDLERSKIQTRVLMQVNDQEFKIAIDLLELLKDYNLGNSFDNRLLAKVLLDTFENLNS